MADPMTDPTTTEPADDPVDRGMESLERAMYAEPSAPAALDGPGTGELARSVFPATPGAATVDMAHVVPDGPGTGGGEQRSERPCIDCGKSTVPCACEFVPTYPAPSPGTVLGEEAEEALASLLLLDPERPETVEEARRSARIVLDLLAPHVAALVRAAAQEARDQALFEAREAEALAVAAEKEREGGAGLISIERVRQIAAEGRTPDHDATHRRGELARAAAMYALPAEYRYDDVLGAMWPRDWRFKPTPEDRLRELVKAGALIAAEIDRLLP